MVQLTPPFRAATAADSQVLAEFVNYASEGMALYLWTKSAAGGDAWEVGRQRARRETGGFSYRNAVVLEQQGRVVAGMVGYLLPAHPEPIPPDMPAMFVPLQELENLAPGTWYVNVLAAIPGERGKGHGAALLGVADRLATAAGARALSIIVSEANIGARRLYERCGYRELARRPKVKNGWQGEGREWVLLIKQT
ncbi:MAG TPA: GNAT family N-acetyltransferase [Hyphomicrobiaceae bacterium]|nr:GNAT family N-acetyltransferase [Hyphomicrobiaceae bacterium]